jgi:hypothetical protein
MKIFGALVVFIISTVCHAEDASLLELSKDAKREMYRFSWSRSFHDKIVYTVDITNPKKPTINIKKFSGEKREKLISESTASLTPTHTFNLRGFLTGAQFWTLPKHKGSGGLDGATWQLEGIKEGGYHSTIRWSPLPPYFGWQADERNGRYEMKRLNPPFEEQVKHSDEVGLDMLCLYIMLMSNQEPEEIY